MRHRHHELLKTTKCHRQIVWHQNVDLVTANNLTSECRPCERSLIQIRKTIQNSPKTEPCGTPALTFFYFEDWPSRTTLSYLLCKKDSIRLKKIPSVPMFLSLCIRHLCQTLSKALDKSRKKPRTSKEELASNAVKMLRVIATSWCMQESPGLKPDWLTLSRKFWSKKS